MRIQFNLLPDVKQQYIKAQKTKRTISAIAVLVSIGCVALLIIMMSVVYGVNKLQLAAADSNIKKYEKQLNNITDLNKILTIQTQLSTISSLHQNKHVASRLFDYLVELTPTTVKMGRIQMDLSQNTLQIDGTADSQKSINTFIDTLKFTTYKIDGKDTGTKAFTQVIENSFGIEKNGDKQVASYTLNIQFDPALFENSQKITLNIPAGVTTRSVLDDPSNQLFNGQTEDTLKKSNAGNQ